MARYTAELSKSMTEQLTEIQTRSEVRPSSSPLLL